jgi:hypothetical protein
MRKTLLSMVQSILSDMDSEDVNSIADTVEAQQIASVIQDTYFNIIAAREIPEHKQMLQLTSLSDSQKPTHFRYPNNTKEIEKLFYNTATTGSTYTEVYFVEPIDFLNRVDQSGTNTLQVETVAGNVPVFILTDRMPKYYTSFDDDNIIMDAYDSSVEVILQESKSRAYGTVYPTFEITDSFEPDIDDTMLPYLLAEAKSTCFSLFKSGADPKVEQAARRLKSYVQNDMHKTKRENKRPHYGRH